MGCLPHVPGMGSAHAFRTGIIEREVVMNKSVVSLITGMEDPEG